ncbi:retrovirus-related pol polyprotein from transposon TNT 1-94 [Tanacetum coccineum]
MLAEESRSKMILKQQDPMVLEKKVNTTPVDYVVLNQLSQDFEKQFVPQTELSAEQAFWSQNSMNSSDPSPSCRPTKVEVPKELPKVSMVNTSLKKLKHHLAGFDVVVKERTTATAITEGSWGFEHTKSCFRNEIIVFEKALKDLFNTFNQYLIDELSEVQNVFHQMEQAVEQHRLELKIFEVKMNQVLNENERLLEQVINKDIVNIIVNSFVDNAYEKSLVITTLKINRERKLKGKDLADNVAPEMLKIDHSKLNANSKLLCVKCNGYMLSDNHDLCVLDFINDVNARTKYKSVKKSSRKRLETNITVFHKYWIHWRPIGRIFTIVGNACPLTRITTTAEVPLRKPTALENDSPKPVVTLVYSRKPRKSKTNVVQIVLWYLDSGCSKHMTGDRSQLTNFVNKFLGTVKFRNDHVAKILGYGDYQIGNITRVYYVEGLGHNLFSVGTDNGTEFINQTLLEYYEKDGISHETFVARSPQKNYVFEIRNRTLIEVAHTMLIYAKDPLFLWAEAVATACYTQNRSIIRLRHGKTPYELLHDKLPDLSFFHVFGALCYPTNDSENLEKLQPKVDIDFDELTTMASEHSSLEPALHEMKPALTQFRLDQHPPPSNRLNEDGFSVNTATVATTVTTARVLNVNAAIVSTASVVTTFEVMWIVQDIRHKFGLFYFRIKFVILSFSISNHYKELTELEIQEMVILVSGEAYDKVFNHLDMLHVPPEGKVFITTANQNRRDLPRDILLVSVEVLRYDIKRSKCENKGRVPTEMELILEQTQQERFYTSAGNPVKEILLKLNLPDHRSILTDSKMEVKVPDSSYLKDS